MRTWLDLETRFRGLIGPLEYVRLDAQWGGQGDFCHLAGDVPDTDRREFETLCGVGGRLLERSLDRASEMGRVLLAEADPVQRWYLLLAKYSGAIESVSSGHEDTADGRQSVYSGSIYRPAAVSANQCLDLEVRFPVRDDTKWHQRVYDDYGRQIVIGGFTALVAAIIGIFFG